jgi:hypothetical protein
MFGVLSVSADKTGVSVTGVTLALRYTMPAVVDRAEYSS